MEISDLRIRLALLWLLLAVATSALLVLCLLIPGVAVAGEFDGMPINEVLLSTLALFFLIPMAMAFLSVSLKDSRIRWADIIAALFFAGFSIHATTSHLDGHLEKGGLALSLMEVSRIVAAILIIWYAWKWPKPED